MILEAREPIRAGLNYLERTNFVVSNTRLPSHRFYEYVDLPPEERRWVRKKRERAGVHIRTLTNF